MPNVTIPAFVTEVHEALRDFFQEGATVQALAEHVGASYPAARRALSYAMRTKTVAKRRGRSDGTKKRPPDLYSLMKGEDDGGDVEQDVIDQDTIQEEHMPDISESTTDPDEAAEFQQEGSEETAGTEAPDLPEEPRPPQAPLPQAPSPARVRQPKGSPAHAVQAFNRREIVAGQKLMEARTGHEPGKTMKVERIDPIPVDFPEEEKGVLGAAFELAVVGDLEEHIRKLYGGGTYKVHTCDATGNIWGGRYDVVTIMGLPVPQTPRGRVWLQAYNQKSPGADGLSGHGAPDLVTMMGIMDNRTAAARQEMTSQFNQTLQLMAPKAPDTTGIKELNESHAKELEKVRTDAERRVTDVKEAMGIQVKNLETQIVALREDLRNERTALTNAFVKEKADILAAHLEKVAALQAAHGKELSGQKEQSAKDLAAARDQATKDLEVYKKSAELMARISTLEKGPKDINYEVQKGMIPEIIRIATTQAKRAAGVVDEDEGPETMMDALKAVVVEAGPEVMKRVAGGIMTLVEQKAGAAPAGAGSQRPGVPPRPAQPPRQPGTFPVRYTLAPPPPGPAKVPTSQAGSNMLLRDRVAPAVPPPPPPVVLTEEEQAALISRGSTPAPTASPIQGDVDGPDLEPSEPPAEEPALTPVQQATALRLQTFFEVLFTEMQIDSEASEVWTVPINGTDMTFEDLFFKLPGAARKAMEGAEPEMAWKAVLAALNISPTGDPLLQAIQDHLDRNPTAHVWLTEFFEAGPWNQVEDEEAEEEDLVPDPRPPAAGSSGVPEGENHPDHE